MPKWVFALIKHPWKLVMAIHAFLYRRSSGAIGGRDRNMLILLLTTIGRKSGKKLTRPVMYIKDGANYVIAASNAGLDRHPAWFLNLRSNPQVTIEVGGMKKTVMAVQASPEERERLWSQWVAKAPFYGDYQKRTTRQIPMVILRPVQARS